MSKRLSVNPMDAYFRVIAPEAQRALERGAARGDMWVEHALKRPDPAENMKHTIEVHVNTRLHEAVQLLDYGDVDAAYAAIGSALG